MTTPCDCAAVPVSSSRGGEHVHVTDERGTWHVLLAGGERVTATLLAPSAEEEAREQALRAQAAPERLAPLLALALVVDELRGGARAPAEAHAVVDELTEAHRG